MALIDYGAIGTMKERELLYTMNGKPVYRDELRPVGQSPKMVISWQKIFFAAYLVAGALYGWFL